MNEQRKIRVAIVSDGTSQHTINRVRLLQESEALDLFFIHQWPRMENRTGLPDARFLQTEVYKGKNPVRRVLSSLKRLRWNIRTLHSLQPDVVFILFGEKIALLSALLSPFPFVISAWGGDFLKAQGAQNHVLARLILRQSVRKAAHIFAVSKELVRTIADLGGTNIQYLYYGLDTRFFAPPPEDGKQPEGFIVYSPRWCRPEYNMETIVRAFALFAQSCPDARLAYRDTDWADTSVAQACRKKIQALIAAEGLEKRCTPLGLSDQAGHKAQMARAQVVISMAPSDGTPVSVLEAMAMGKIVVCGNIPSLNDLIEDKYIGFLAPLDDPRLIAGTLIYIYKNFGEVQRRVGTNARHFAETQADIHREVAVYVDTLCKIGGRNL